MNTTTVIAKPVIEREIRSLCYTPYPGHKKGCPNYGEKKGCPPSAPMFWDYFREDWPVILICTRFDLASHIAKMRWKHPTWTDRQLTCCLYWQGTARKKLREEIDHTLRHFPPGYEATTCPEAMGVNVTETCRRVGILLEWPPKNIACQIALAGKRKETT